MNGRYNWHVVVSAAAIFVVAVFSLSGCDNQPIDPPSDGEASAGKIPFVTTSSFDREVLESQVPVLVDFYADWCGPCKIQGRILEEIAPELSQRAKIVKLDVDKDPDLAARFEVSAIPTLVIVKDGKEIARHVGVTSKKEIMTALADD